MEKLTKINTEDLSVNLCSCEFQILPISISSVFSAADETLETKVFYWSLPSSNSFSENSHPLKTVEVLPENAVKASY